MGLSMLGWWSDIVGYTGRACVRPYTLRVLTYSKYIAQPRFVEYITFQHTSAYKQPHLKVIPESRSLIDMRFQVLMPDVLHWHPIGDSLTPIHSNLI